MELKTVQKLFIGRWQFTDGRIIEFKNEKELNLYDKSGKILAENQEYYLSKNQYGDIQLMIPVIFVALALLRSISKDKMIYDEFAPAASIGTRVELTKL